MATESFVESRLISLPSRFMESALPAPKWRRFKAEAARRLADAFGSRVCLEVHVNLAVGTKPGPRCEGDAKRRSGALRLPSLGKRPHAAGGGPRA